MVYNIPQITPQVALSLAQPGDTLLFQPGTYFPTSFGDSVPFLNLNVPGLRLISVTPGGAILDGQMKVHAPLWLGANSRGTFIDGFKLTMGIHAGLHSNSLGGQGVVVRNCQVSEIARKVDNSTIGNTGIYTDEKADITIENCKFWNIGRTNQTINSFDHSIYSHGRCKIKGNVFLNSLNGWHIQTAVGFSGEIADNYFDGPNLFPGKPGQIMLWGSCGAIMMKKNIHKNSFQTALTSYDFSSSALIIEDVTVIGGAVLGAPSGAIIR